MNTPLFSQLSETLHQRLEVVADHALRDRDPAALLEK